MKVAELTGTQLDYWAARAEGADLGPEWDQDDFVMVGGHSGRPPERYSPSTEWSQGGPIIERERIAIQRGDSSTWDAIAGGIFDYGEEGIRGATALEAAMRAYIAAKFGDEVSDEGGI